MRLLPTVALAGVASLALAGSAYAACHHVMKVDLPGGGVAQIEYEGNVPPKVKLVSADDPAFAARRVGFFNPFYDPFARMDAIFAAMERQHARMMREIAAMEAAAARGELAPGAPLTFVSTGAPQGGSFTFVSTTTSGNGTCGRTVQITQRPGESPRRVERTFGDCSAAQPSVAPAAAPSPRNTV